MPDILKRNKVDLDVGRNTLQGTSKPARAFSAGLEFPALRLPETPTLADAGRSYSGLRRAAYNDESWSLGTSAMSTKEVENG
jgi:hypothetical protein